MCRFCARAASRGTDTPHSSVRSTRYEREHPDVPVVRNLEDMWMVQKMEQLKKKAELQAAWEAERAKRRAEVAAKSAAGGDAERSAAPAGVDVTS